MDLLENKTYSLKKPVVFIKKCNQCESTPILNFIISQMFLMIYRQ